METSYFIEDIIRNNLPLEETPYIFFNNINAHAFLNESFFFDINYERKGNYKLVEKLANIETIFTIIETPEDDNEILEECSDNILSHICNSFENIIMLDGVENNIYTSYIRNVRSGIFTNIEYFISFFFIKNIPLFACFYYVYIKYLKNNIFNSLNIFVYKLFNEYTNNILNKNSIKNIFTLLITNFIFVSILYIFSVCEINSIYSLFIGFYLNIAMSAMLFITFKTRILINIRGFYSNFSAIKALLYDSLGIVIFFSRFFLQSVRVVSCIAFFFILNELNLVVLENIYSLDVSFFYDNRDVREGFFFITNVARCIFEYLDVILSYTTNNIVFLSINIWLTSFLLTSVHKKAIYYKKIKK